MQYIATLNGKQFAVESDMPLTPEQINNYASQQMQGQGGDAKAAGMVKLGTAVCGGPYVQNTQKTLTGSVTSGGTAPFTYTWTITKPDETIVTPKPTGAVQPYVFAQVGTYTIKLDVVDSCLPTGMTDSATCSVVITATCVIPVCNINIA